MNLSFKQNFETLTGHQPFPWQADLFRRFTEDPTPGHIPAAASIPTGLGKTSVIAVWLLAWLKCPDRMPRRLAYVVNRRTVVDQTTREVERIRDRLDALALPDLADRIGSDGLAVSTLRGQFADNRAWSADPSRPAVVCGTVDMIGSRLLFSGYRAGFKTRPMQAALLGCDTLLVHDESHLEPAFQAALDAIVAEQAAESERRSDGGTELPGGGLRVMPLSATQRGMTTALRDASVLELTDADREYPVVKKRLGAAKRLTVKPIGGDGKDKDLATDLASCAIELAGSEHAVLIFAQRVTTVDAVTSALEKLLYEALGKDAAVGRVSLLIGPMRGHERERLAKSDPVFARFVPPSDRAEVEPKAGPVFLLATAAGEVGVNLSADHLVCDLTPLDSMIQRFGRVNRFGDRGDTEIHVFAPKPKDFTDKGLDPARERTLAWLDRLNGDASPDSLETAKQSAPAATQAAFSPPPALLQFSDILFDAWAMTSLVPPLSSETLPGCPPVAPYLHGIAEWDPPQTRVAWRHEIGCFDDMIGDPEPDQLLADYPLKPHELLADLTSRVVDTLFKRAELADPKQAIPVWIVPGRGKTQVNTLRDLASRGKNGLVRTLADVTLILPPAAGMLDRGGRLTDGLPSNGRTPKKGETFPDAYDVAERWADDNGAPYRHRGRPGSEPEDGKPSNMRLVREIALGRQHGNPDEPTLWRWYARPAWADDQGSRTAREAQRLDDHLKFAEAHARRYAKSLGLGASEVAAVRLAAAWHDLGKNRERWQHSIGNFAYDPTDPASALAKSGPGQRAGATDMAAILDGYRHEFGSVLDLFGDPPPEFSALDSDTQDLLLHLIAAHHGRARPHFPAGEARDVHLGHEEGAATLALETPRRFASLQAKYGRWGLALLESLVRAADYAASDPSTPVAQDVVSEGAAQ